MTNTHTPNLVSTIIPVFNRPEMIKQAVASVLSQEHRPIEIIIVDDGSTDATPEVLMELAKVLPEVKVFSQENAGPGAARELGRRAAKGEFIQYLDSDDLLLPIKFSAQVAALHADDNCDVAYGKTQLSIVGKADSEVAWRRTGEKIDTMFPLFVYERWWATSTPLYRARICDAIGPWTATINEEDWEYDCRIASTGARLAFVDEFVSIHRRHDQHLSSEGNTHPLKLRHRCLARQSIYQSILESEIEIDDLALEHFSKSAFLLARVCAEVDLGSLTLQMLDLAAQAHPHTNGKPTIKQASFRALGNRLGWPRAASIARLVR